MSFWLYSFRASGVTQFITPWVNERGYTNTTLGTENKALYNSFEKRNRRDNLLYKVYCSAPFNYNSMRLETKTDFSHMSVFSKSQLSGPNRLGDMRAWSYYVALKIWSTRLIHSNFKPSYLRDGWGQSVEISKTHSYDWNLFSFPISLSCS